MTYGRYAQLARHRVLRRDRSPTSDRLCPGYHKASAPGDLIIKFAGQSEYGGSGSPGTLSVSGTWVDGSCIVGASAGPMQQRDYGAANAGFSCQFANVDLENGGSYEVHASGEESEWAVCTLEIKVSKEHM
jgi:hypothetical protein